MGHRFLLVVVPKKRMQPEYATGETKKIEYLAYMVKVIEEPVAVGMDPQCRRTRSVVLYKWDLHPSSNAQLTS